MKNGDDIIKIYYGNDDYKDPQIEARAKAENVKVLPIDVTKTKLTGTQILQMAEKLNVDVSEMVNKNVKDYDSIVTGKSYDKEGWLNILLENPILIRPMAERGKRMVFLDTAFDIRKIAKNDQNVNGLFKSQHNE